MDSLLGGVDSVSSAFFLPSQFTRAEAAHSALPTTIWRGAFVAMLGVAGLTSRKRSGRALLAALLGTLALLAWAARWFGGMPEMASNQAWLLYCPLDCCLAWRGPWSGRYLWLRVTLVVALMLASLVGFIAQPLLWPALALTAAFLARATVQSSGGLLHEGRGCSALGLRGIAGLRRRW
jgi:hypothetical protein